MGERENKILDGIIRDCFWEYDFMPESLMKIAIGNNQREQQFLFEKIFENSTNVLQALWIFPDQILFGLIKRQNPSRFGIVNLI